MPNFKLPRIYGWVVPITLFFLYLGLRLHALLALPPFLDEADHVAWANDLVLYMHPFTGASNGKLFGLWWMTAFQLHGEATFWIVRASVVWFNMLGVAVVYSLVRNQTRSMGIAALAALVALVAPYNYFYERMALVDTFVSVWGLLAAWFCVRWAKSGQDRDALGIGLSLAATIAAKATGVMIVPIAALAAILLAQRLSLRQRLRGMALAYGLMAGVWIPFYLFLRWRGYNYFGTATTVVGTDQTGNLFGRLIANVSSLLEIDSTHFGVPFLILILLLAVILLVRHPRIGLFWCGALVIPIMGLLAFATKISARYTHFHVGFLLILGALGIGAAFELLARRRMTRIGAFGVGIAALLWVGAFALPTLQALTTDVTLAPLTPLERLEYISSDASGYGLREIADAIRSQTGETPAQVIGLLPNCRGLQFLIRSADPVALECPTIALDGSQQVHIAGRINQLAADIAAGRTTGNLYLVFDQVPFISLEGISSTLIPVYTIQRPDELTTLTLFQIAPE
jgi:4-amino-4-deoxy-L-arabinose transferase-like glycosyltransferase